MIGPVTLILAWLSSADKAESPRGRAWGRAYLLIMSAIAISMISFIFFFSGENTAWMGWVVLGTSVLVSAVLLIRRPQWVAEVRENIERRWTAAHLQRIQNEFVRAEQAWKRAQVRPPVVVRSLAAIIGLFREASRAAGEHRDFRA